MAQVTFASKRLVVGNRRIFSFFHLHSHVVRARRKGLRVSKHRAGSPRGPKRELLDVRAFQAAPVAGHRRASVSQRRTGLPSRPPLVLAGGLAALTLAAWGSVSAVAPTSLELTADSVASGKLDRVTVPQAKGVQRLEIVSRSSRRDGTVRATALQATVAQRQASLKTIEAAAKAHELILRQLRTAAAQRAAYLAAHQWVTPISSYNITATFGQSSYLWSSVHTGVDLAAPTGTPVMSVATGTIVNASYSGSYGNRIVVKHDDGTETWYAHLNSIAVASGQSVSAGEVIGTVGATGNVTGPHLHLEFHPGGGSAVDPVAALADLGLLL